MSNVGVKVLTKFPVFFDAIFDVLSKILPGELCEFSGTEILSNVLREFVDDPAYTL